MMNGLKNVDLISFQMQFVMLYIMLIVLTEHDLLE